MTPAQAKDLLLHHAFTHPESANHPKSESGFLGSLRPYRGHLVEDNFREVMEALRALAPTLSGEAVDREVVGALRAICHLGRAWGGWPDGLLRRNGLISAADVTTLEEWVDSLSYSTFCLLDGTGCEVAFEHYDREVGSRR